MYQMRVQSISSELCDSCESFPTHASSSRRKELWESKSLFKCTLSFRSYENPPILWIMFHSSQAAKYSSYLGRKTNFKGSNRLQNFCGATCNSITANPFFLRNRLGILISSKVIAWRVLRIKAGSLVWPWRGNWEGSRISILISYTVRSCL